MAPTLFEVTFTLYVEGDFSGAIELGPGLPNSWNIRQNFRNITTAPTGASNIRNHPIPAGFVITLDRSYFLKQNAHGSGQDFTRFDPDLRRYVMDMVSQDETTGDWLRVVFRGATIGDARSLAAAPEGHITDGQIFLAETMDTPVSGRGLDGAPAKLNA